MRRSVAKSEPIVEPPVFGMCSRTSVTFCGVAIMGSREAGIANRLCMESNVGETGIWRFQIRGGTVVCRQSVVHFCLIARTVRQMSEFPASCGQSGEDG